MCSTRHGAGWEIGWVALSHVQTFFNVHKCLWHRHFHIETHLPPAAECEIKPFSSAGRRWSGNRAKSSNYVKNENRSDKRELSSHQTTSKVRSRQYSVLLDTISGTLKGLRGWTKATPVASPVTLELNWPLPQRHPKVGGKPGLNRNALGANWHDPGKRGVRCAFPSTLACLGRCCMEW